MFGKGVKLFTLFGFSVRVDWSWIIIAVLVTWSLATGLFPSRIPGQTYGTYWLMGAIGAVGLFASVVFHEFAHSLVARRGGMEMRGITLFIFGGVAEMTDEPPDAGTEFRMAIVGPISSFVLAGICWAVLVASRVAGWPATVQTVLAYLAGINALLALFNLIPAYPLDGGRVLRSALWAWKGNIRWATRVASAFGNGFGILLIFLGILRFITGDFVGGIWYFLIGSFLRNAAAMSYQQVLLRDALGGVPIGRFIVRQPVTVPADISVASLVDDYIYRYHFQMFPVISGGDLAGCISTAEVKEIPREEWDRRTVGSVMKQCSIDTTVHADMDAMQVLARMNRTGASRMLVVEDGHLAGIVTLKDLLGFLAMKIDLEDTGHAESAAPAEPRPAEDRRAIFGPPTHHPV